VLGATLLGRRKTTVAWSGLGDKLAGRDSSRMKAELAQPLSIAIAATTTSQVCAAEIVKSMNARVEGKDVILELTIPSSSIDEAAKLLAVELEKALKNM